MGKSRNGKGGAVIEVFQHPSEEHRTPEHHVKVRRVP
jgi:hypothetical protein